MAASHSTAGRCLKVLTAREWTSFQKSGYLVSSSLLSPQQVDQVVRWTTEIEHLPETSGKWMHYYEFSRLKHQQHEQLCRTENFIPFHEGLRFLLCDEQSKIVQAVSDLLEEPAVIFKEKINYKHPGGGSFPAHQDAPAYTAFRQKSHLSLAIAIDSTTVDNGCLEVVEGSHTQGIFPQDDDTGSIQKQVEDTMQWKPVELKRGEILMFSSFLAHRSKPNESGLSRRVIYSTYNGLSDGQFREKYYEEKRMKFPPRIEREANKDYSTGGKIYNLATPIVY